MNRQMLLPDEGFPVIIDDWKANGLKETYKVTHPIPEVYSRGVIHVFKKAQNWLKYSWRMALY
jgi:hypothetical protein